MRRVIITELSRNSKYSNLNNFNTNEYWCLNSPVVEVWGVVPFDVSHIGVGRVWIGSYKSPVGSQRIPIFGVLSGFRFVKIDVSSLSFERKKHRLWGVGFSWA